MCVGGGGGGGALLFSYRLSDRVATRLCNLSRIYFVGVLTFLGGTFQEQQPSIDRSATKV